MSFKLICRTESFINAHPSHKIVIRVGKDFPAYMTSYISASVYAISGTSEWQIKPVLCELSTYIEDVIKNKHRAGDYVEIYPDEASAVEALQDRSTVIPIQ